MLVFKAQESRLITEAEMGDFVLPGWAALGRSIGYIFTVGADQ